MPIYEYECPSCGVIEVVQGITEKPLARCPKCGKRKVKKLISESSFQLKGSGWYTTDYGRAKGGNGGNGKAKPGEKSDHGEKSDTSPAKETAKDSSAGSSSDKDSSSKKAGASASSS
ncbi:MAG TPA: zinc ribbon domain-containing protein [bacterium]|nr:zinc ribbon domain-containing protein [bacterium]